MIAPYHEYESSKRDVVKPRKHEWVGWLLPLAFLLMLGLAGYLIAKGL